MSYTINVTVNPNSSGFKVVEKTVWYYAGGGTWSESDGIHILTMGGSGTSGTLRFANEAGDYVIFILGVHNYHPYTDIAADLQPGDTCMLVHPSWYGGGERAHTKDWSQARGTGASDCKGHQFSVVVSGEDKDLKASINIQ